MGNETNNHGSSSSGSSSRIRGPPPPEPVLFASIRAPTPNARVHALPCSIQHDGPAAINTYFMPRKAAVVAGEARAAGAKTETGNLKEAAQGKRKRVGTLAEAERVAKGLVSHAHIHQPHDRIRQRESDKRAR